MRAAGLRALIVWRNPDTPDPPHPVPA
jgi:hypothetical protein